MCYRLAPIAAFIAQTGLVTLLMADDLSAQSRTLNVDLGVDPGKTTTVSVPADQGLQLTIINLLPNDRYAYNIFIEPGWNRVAFDVGYKTVAVRLVDEFFDFLIFG